MTTSNHFLSKLPAGHATALLTKHTATALFACGHLGVAIVLVLWRSTRDARIVRGGVVGSLTELFGTGSPTATDCSSQHFVTVAKHSFGTERDRGTV
jgi:hypothetical protein